MAVRVADASILAALIFQEPRRNEAESLLRGADLYAPTLLPYELASIARKKSSKCPGKRPRILEALRNALAMDISLVNTDAVEVAALALDKGLTVYDAAYLWLARSLGAELLTFDHNLRSAASGK